MSTRSRAGSLLHRRGRRPRLDAAARAPVVVRLPVSALRGRLDAASEGTRWVVDPDGLLGRGLVMQAGSALTIPLGLSGDVWLTARAMLLPHDWRDGHGTLHATVTVEDETGTRQTVWTEPLRTGDRGRPRGHRLTCRLPATTTALTLSLTHTGPPGPDQVDRAVWLDPTLIDPAAPPPPTPTTPAPAPAVSATTPPASDPLISVLTPVHDPPLAMLEQTIASVTAQTYPHWELCLVDDGSRDPQIITALQRHAATDPRIHLTRRDTPGGISAATNTALRMATGHYIALLDHDDTLTPDALQHVADTITHHPDLDMIYSDEDIVLDGRVVWTHLKPQWSPDTLRTNGYTCHLGVYRRALVREVGGFRSPYDGSQDVDMILRLTERTDRIGHIPRILYHWRAHATSTAGGDAKPYAYVAARNAIADHLRRVGWDADVGFGPPGLYRLAHRVHPRESADLVLAVSDPAGLAEAAASWREQAHPAWHVILTAPDQILDAAHTALTDAGLPDSAFTLLPTDQDPTTALAAAAHIATAQHIVLMQTPALGLTHDWLTRLIGYSQQPGIAAAGPILLAPDGRIHQAGIALPDGIPLHLLQGTRSSMDDHFGYGTSVYNVSAVSGILVTPRATYHQLGGLDPTLADLALIDYCIRATTTGQRTVIVPDARLRTTATPTNDLPTLWRLQHQWRHTHTHDPYYNPGYRTDRGDFVRV